MPRFSGALINVGIGKETTAGTAVTPSYWLADTDLDFDDSVTKVQNQSRFGTIELNQNAHIVKQESQGSIKGVVYRNSFGLILASALGATSTDAVVETTAKKHTFALANNNQHQSLTIAKKDPNVDLTMALARIDQLTIDYVVDNYVKYDAKYMAKKSVSGAHTPAYAAESEFIPKHVVFKTAATGVSNLTGATALTNIKSIQLVIKKNVKETQGLGNVDLENLVNTDFEVTGKIERYLDDTTFKDFVFNNTHRSMRIDLIDTDTIVGAVTNPSLRFDMAEVVFTAWSEAMGDSDVVVETMEFTALRNFTGAVTLSAELTNDVASY